ncbi:hemolysin III family protein [Rhodococcus sp. HNM0563]|uniref:PAQR family membrane homeostasis protein TrhA n=1 Tax=unclassified Rhodococcus (in: high G+C Gram-positive bacteria) TaxID=192944 RepID=UPI00146B48E5|nr:MULTISPECIES: hemolysin III family protein [unclassified Rhodococcus (in: high G+C Gram-positive bacteria)]MCK0089743.1 hemolysin III family protein [Rhodococcus sp. F64268]NLU62308.1 hemolysin III family protein [Rhodococcus sp. HNM0563]
MTAFGIDELPVKPRMRGWIHLWAFGAAVIAGIVLVYAATMMHPTATWPTLIYSITVCGLFGISALYHRVHWHNPRHRMWMKRADHSMIFVFIAGSYTPFATLALPPETGRTLLTIVWAGAAGGVALKMLWPTAPRWVGVPLYLLLGWAIVPVAGDLVSEVGVAPMVLLVVGGLFYSAGAILYATKWPDPWPSTFGHHEFFHAATVIAAACHAVAVWLVVFT